MINQNKIIMFDIDRTLLHSDGVLSEYSLSILDKARSKGYILVFNSARGASRTTYLASVIKPKYQILNAGNLIIDDQNNIIFENVINKDIINKLLKELKLITDHITIDTRNRVYKTKLNENPYNDELLDLDSDFESDAYKIVVETQNKDELIKLINRYNLNYSNYVGSSYYRISPPNTDKWFGAERLLKHCKLNSKVLAFGDDLDDLMMLEKAYIGVAMKNSHPIVLNKIKRVTLSNDEDGLAFYLENNIL